MQNDLFWYKEKDEDYAMPPLFSDTDYYGDPSEDKYVMTVQTGEHVEDPLAHNCISDGGSVNLKDEAYKDYFELGKPFQLEHNYDWVGGFDNTNDFHSAEKDNQVTENDDYGFIYDEVIGGDEESDALSDELLMYEVKEDDYEIFNLRIIHRKNRSVRVISLLLLIIHNRFCFLI